MDTDSSSLSEPPPSDDETLRAPSKPVLKLLNGKLGGFSRKKSSPPPSSPEPDPKDLGREPSPPHEFVLADNPDVAIVVMFRSRFDAAFPKHVPNLGPQDVEAGVVSAEPSENVENLLCALLGLVLNRKKNPERGHYGRALEECLSSQRMQWPRSWNHKNPLAGGKTFQAMSPLEKLNLLRTLTHWALATSEAVNNIIKDSYKQSRKDDDINQPLSVQSWGIDTQKRRFFLIDGQVDSPFRIYRESARKASAYSWISVAGTIEEAQKVARDLRVERGQAAHRLAARITNAVPMFEEREEKRKRREYRRAQKERFSRPEPGFSLYEGRTRGKRMKYTYDDDEDIYGTDENRRSSRQSRTATPGDGPKFTASGRQVRSAFGRSYGDRPAVDGTNSTPGSSDPVDEEISDQSQALPRADGRARRLGRQTAHGLRGSARIPGYNSVDELADESDAASTGEEWGGEDQDFEGKFDDAEDEDDADDSSMAGSDDSFGAEPKSLIVRLKCRSKADKPANAGVLVPLPEREIPDSKKERLRVASPGTQMLSTNVSLIGDEMKTNGLESVPPMQMTMSPSVPPEASQTSFTKPGIGPSVISSVPSPDAKSSNKLSLSTAATQAPESASQLASPKLVSTSEEAANPLGGIVTSTSSDRLHLGNQRSPQNPPGKSVNGVGHSLTSGT